MLWEQRIQYGSLSDVGFRRQNNEDSLSIRMMQDEQKWRGHGHLFMVADGMGGHAVGELASKIAVDTVPHNYFKSENSDQKKSLRDAVLAANAAIYERAAANHEFQRMGTTCSSLVLGPQGALVGHVGDSRVYRIRGERIDQLSRDHSLEWELKEQSKGEVDPALYNRSKHVITRSLGPERVVEADTEGPYPILEGDIYILCSDGLTGHLEDEELGAICTQLAPAEACKMLVNLANLRGGADNISVIVVKVGPLAARPSQHEMDTVSPKRSPLGAGWWIAIWSAAVVLTSGICFSLLDQPGLAVAGILTGGVAVLLILLFWFRKRDKEESTGPKTGEDNSATIVWRPYRTASAKMTSQFRRQIVEILQELKRTAQQENWQMDWGKYEELQKQAEEATSNKRPRELFLQHARIIDEFMKALKLQREASRA